MATFAAQPKDHDNVTFQDCREVLAQDTREVEPEPPLPEDNGAAVAEDPRGEQQQQTAEAHAPEELFDVMLDIILDALGLLGLATTLREAAGQIDGFEEAWEEVAAAGRTGQAELVVGASIQLVDFLGSKAAIQQWLQPLNQPQRRALLRALSIRCVPLVGQALVVVAFGLSVSRHWTGYSLRSGNTSVALGCLRQKRGQTDVWKAGRRQCASGVALAAGL